MSWAVTLSGYQAPAQMPEVRQVPHSFLTQAACKGVECRVLGWFPPGRTIYLDERLKPNDDLIASSILVHEMVHYLQYQRKGAGERPFNCEETIGLEREAYQVQREFLLRYGVIQPVGVAMHRVGCELAAH